MRRTPARFLAVLTICAAAFSFFSAHRAIAQTWVGPPGEGSVSLTYQYLDVRKHLFSVEIPSGLSLGGGYVGSGSQAVDIGHIQANTALLGFDYAIIRNLGASGQLAYVTSRYTGNLPEGPWDDGAFHGTFQDADLSLRYMVLRQPFALTPELTFHFPTHHYMTLGHTVVGTNLRELQFALAAGRSLGPWVRDAYVTAMYEHAFVERLPGYSWNLDRNQVSAELGYFVNRKLSVRAFGGYTANEQGMDWATGIRTITDWMNHDAAANAKYWRLGGGATYGVTRDFALFGAIAGTVSGQNTHAGTGYSFGMSQGFRNPFEQRARGAE